MVNRAYLVARNTQIATRVQDKILKSLVFGFFLLPWYML
jgi:hypothetical protein